MAKALNEHGSDGEERKLGEQTGLDIEKFLNLSVVSSKLLTKKNYGTWISTRLITRVVLAVNAVY